MRRALAVSWLTCLLGCAADVGIASEANVYGEDDRRDPYLTSGRLTTEEAARFDAVGKNTVGVFVRDRHVHLDDPERVLLCGSNVDDYPEGREDGCFTRTLAWNVFSDSDFGDDAVTLCGDEPFALQPSIGRCSGTLIAEDLVLTSGHCFDASTDVETSVFVFDWRYDHAPSEEATFDWRVLPTGEEVPYWIEMPAPGLATIEREDVYHVVEAHYVYDRADRLRPSGATTTSTLRDYAIVRLDRPVSGPRRPAPIQWAQRNPAPGTALVVAGFGKGLPLKLDDGAAVTFSWYCDPRFNPDLFCNTHDGYSGASGSGVFTLDGALVGAHRGSETDFELDEAAGCYRSRVVDDAASTGSFPAAAHRASAAVADFCANGFAPDSPLCGEPALRVPDASRCPAFALEAFGGQVCCERECALDADCAADPWGGRCAPDGFCRRKSACFAGQLWERDACGRPALPVDGTEDACASVGDACSSAEPLEPIEQTIALSFEGLHDRFRGTCGGYGVDRVFTFTLAAQTDVGIELDGDVVQFMITLRREACEGLADELACVTSGAEADARFDGTLEAGRYYLIIDTEPSPDRRAHPWSATTRMHLRFDPVAGPGGDGGDLEPPPDMDGGCACRVRSRPGRGAGAGWLAAALLLRRRRRARRATSR